MCTGSITGIDLDVTPAGTYCPTTYTAAVYGYCRIESDFLPININLPWYHSTFFGDSSPPSRVSTRRNQVSGSHVYIAADEYEMTHWVFCPCPSAFNYGGASVTLSVPGGTASCLTVRVDSADIVRDQIVVTLSPSTASGTLQVELVGTPAHTVSTTTAAGGTHRISFNIATLPVGEYTGVRATWTVGTNTPTDTKAYSFQVLGDYRQSQYNTPTESSCTGPPAPAYVTDTHCTYTPTTFKSDFITQADLNGSSISLYHGTLSTELWCHLNERPHPDDSDDRSFRMGHTIVGSCGSAVTDSTVAVNSGHPHLRCGDSVYIVGVGVKTVTDSCPICTETQLDNYTTSPNCNRITDIGTSIKTIKLGL